MGVETSYKIGRYERGRLFNFEKMAEQMRADSAPRLRSALRQAKLMASAVPTLSTVPGSAGERWTNHYKGIANRRVRQIQKRMENLGIPEQPKFWKPRPEAKADARIARKFKQPKHITSLKWAGWTYSRKTRQGMEFF